MKPQFSQPLCQGTSDGDTDLGAPNSMCSIPGPGK